MAGIQQLYGSLDENGNVTDKMREIFIGHRQNILANGKSNLPYTCYETEKKENPTIVEDINDREKYKTFHDNWVDGILADCLNILNLESNISIPIFDPIALGAKLDPGGSQPPLDFATMLGSLAIPPPASIATTLLTLNIDITKLAEYTDKINNDIIKAVPVPEVPIPPIPSPNFPNLEYPSPGLNLKDRQIAIYTALPTALSSLVSEIANPEFMADLASNGPATLFEKSCQALSAAMPKSSITNPETVDANTGALISSLSKPMSATAMGVVVGASENGPAGGLGALEPDKVKEPPADPVISDDSIIVPTLTNAPGYDISKRTTPDFRRKLFDMLKQLTTQYPKIKINHDWLAVCMTIESAGTFLPSVRSGEISKPKPGGGTYQWGESHKTYTGNQGPAVGLIQFTSIALNNSNKTGINDKLGTNYTLESLGNMTQVEQLDAVKDYFIAVTNKGNTTIDNPVDTYIAIFLPVFIGKKAEILASSDTEQGKQIIQGNPSYSKDGGKTIKRSTIASIINGLLFNANKNGRIYCDVQKFVPGSGTLAPPAPSIAATTGPETETNEPT